MVQKDFTKANTHSSISLNKQTKKLSLHRTGRTPFEKKAVAEARKAKNACDPPKGGILCDSNRAAWREKENLKNRIKIKAKQALQKHNELNPKSATTKTWAFVKAWTNGARPQYIT
jgi:hypothetical protein